MIFRKVNIDCSTNDGQVHQQTAEDGAENGEHEVGVEETARSPAKAEYHAKGTAQHAEQTDSDACAIDAAAQISRVMGLSKTSNHCEINLR